jgi:lipid II:glycine glycyltransferase (peptidoglycan interpeptide bridge formation enzyme)
MSWDAFTARHPKASLYHDSRWHRVITETYNYETLYHLVKDEKGEIRAGLPSAYIQSRLTGNRIVAYPFSDTCDLLAETPEDKDALRALLKDAAREKGVRFFETRETGACEEREYVTHQLSLTRSLEELQKNCHPSCIRRPIRKAAREGVTIAAGTTREFYRLHLLTRCRQGVPVQPHRFFENLAAVFKADHELMTARKNERPLASLILLYHKGTAYFKFGASDPGRELAGANQLLMWQAITRARDRGCEIFDLGRTSLANQGLREYKGRWGAEEIPLCYTRMPKASRSAAQVETSRRHRLLKTLFRRLPPWANRLTGELFYRHFG